VSRGNCLTCRGLQVVGALAMAFVCLSATPAAAVTQSWIGSEILANSVSVQVGGVPGSGVMQATFKPKFGFSLAGAAAYYGLDNFNWKQSIIAVPTGWAFEKVDIDTNTVVGSLSLPISDPLQDSLLSRIQASVGGMPVDTAHTALGFRDLSPAYWGQNSDLSKLPGGLNAPGVQTASQLLFSDRPTFPSALMGSNDYFTFKTELVGVKNGEIVTLDGVAGISFVWSTNATTADSTVRLAVSGDEVVPPVFSGGVFDAHIVPEPSSLILMAVGFASFVVFAWRRRKA
jgi:hypothetical protein